MGTITLVVSIYILTSVNIFCLVKPSYSVVIGDLADKFVLGRNALSKRETTVTVMLTLDVQVLRDLL